MVLYVYRNVHFLQPLSPSFYSKLKYVANVFINIELTNPRNQS